MKKIIFAATTALLLMAGATLSAQEQQPRAQRTFDPETTAKERTAELVQKLGLNKEQEAKVYALNLEQAKQMQQMREERKARHEQQTADRDKMRAEMKSKHEARAAEMKRILTDEQYKKWEQMQREQMGRHRGGPHGKHPHHGGKKSTR